MNANTFRATMTFFAGRRGDQCIIFRDQGSTDPPGGLKFQEQTQLQVKVYIIIFF